MRRWVLLGAIGGLLGGAVAGLVEGALDGAVRLRLIGEEALLWSVGLACGAAAAYLPSHWAWRGIAGGTAYGVARSGLTFGLSLTTAGWGPLLISEVFGGVVGGLILAYLWRPSGEGEGTTGTA